MSLGSDLALLDPSADASSPPPTDTVALDDQDPRPTPPEAIGSQAEQQSSSLFGQVGPYGVFLACWSALLSVAFDSRFDYPTFTPKYAVMVLAAAVGVVPLYRMASDRTTRWIAGAVAGFLAVGLLSALLSQAPNVGLFGMYQWGTAWLFWLSCAGAFAIGASLRGKDLDWFFYGLLVGAVLNAGMAVYQMVGHPTSGALQAFAGGTQADGFFGNPVHLEALMLGAIALVSSRACDAPKRWWWLLVLFGVALELTGERVALPVLALIFAVVLVRRRARGLVVVCSTGAGFLIAFLVGGSSLVHRVTAGTAETTFGLRVQLWRDALHGLAHFPLIGTGPGELLRGTAPYVTPSFGRALNGRLFTDAHDVVLEVLVTTGILGLLCFGAWLVQSVRVGRGTFVGFALCVFAVELVEPLNIGITPLAFAALGGAVAVGLTHRRDAVEAPPPETEPTTALPPTGDDDGGQPGSGGVDEGFSAGVSAGRLLSAALVLAALALGATMLIGDNAYSETQLGLQQLSSAQRASQLLPYWVVGAEAVGFYWRYEYSVHHGPSARNDLATALHWYEDAAASNPAEPDIWWSIGSLDRLLGDRRAAIAAFQRSLADDPAYAPAISSLAAVDLNEHQFAAARALYQRLRLLGPLGPQDLRNATLARRGTR